MVKATLVLALFIFSIRQIDAQIRTTQLSLKDSGVAELYLGFRNKVKFAGLRQGDKVFFGTTTPYRLDTNIYVLVPSSDSQNTVLVKRRNITIFSKRFCIRHIPDPNIQFGTVRTRIRPRAHSYYASVQEVLTYPKLVIETRNVNLAFHVVSFEFAIARTGFYETWLYGKGDSLSKDQITAVERLVPGDKIYFENIRITGPDDVTRTFVNLAIVIK